MNWRIGTALVLAFAMVPALPAVQASHFQAYANFPSEHDDLGSSLEPDFFGTTGILGVPVEERNIDFDLSGRGEPSSTFAGRGILAPGCTDDAGRQPNGLCGLWNIGAYNGAEGTDTNIGFPPRTLGSPGSSGPAAPGLTALKAKQLRFLDQKSVSDYAPPATGTMFTDYNWKLRDLGVSALLGGLGENFGGQFLFNSNAHFSWYGKWADKNGNGVIDHLQAGLTPQKFPIENPNNEFQFYGNCFVFDSTTKKPGWHCFDESKPNERVTMAAYIFPGNHHAYCGVALANQATQACDKVGIDLPGAAMLCLADALTTPVAPVTATLLGRCFTPNVGAVDPNEQEFEGDPLFGQQELVNPDQTFDDRTGDEGFDTRGWFYGLGWPTYYYDQSLVTSTFIITVVGCIEDPSAGQRFYDLDSCRFVDVDVYPTWSPVLEEALRATVKPQARSSYTLLRDSAGPVSSGADGQINNRRTDTTATTGPLDDQLQDPGFGREPNHPQDAYPGAAFNVDGCAAGDALFNGWCNDYAGYRAAARGWADLQVFRSITYDRAIYDPTGGCRTCVAGPGITTTLSPEPVDGGLRGSGDHSRSLGPGGYFLGGAAGRWKDQPQVHVEDYVDFDPANLGGTFGQSIHQEYLLPADGWIGSVVNATGAFYYRGYGNEACTTEDGPGNYPYGFCHPYNNGAISDPQQPGTTAHGEWAVKTCDDTARAQLIPAGGAWTVPVFVIRDHGSIPVPSVLTNGQIQDLTGTTGPITIGVGCGEFGGFLSNDFFILPLGNLDLDITTHFVASVPLFPSGGDTVVDVDLYEGWGA